MCAASSRDNCPAIFATAYDPPGNFLTDVAVSLQNRHSVGLDLFEPPWAQKLWANWASPFSGRLDQWSPRPRFARGIRTNQHSSICESSVRSQNLCTKSPVIADLHEFFNYFMSINSSETPGICILPFLCTCYHPTEIFVHQKSFTQFCQLKSHVGWLSLVRRADAVVCLECSTVVAIVSPFSRR
jgi:hypothetical protein